MPKTVYLGGPIAGLNYEGATSWREDVQAKLKEINVEALSPMRAKNYLSHVTSFTKDPDTLEGKLSPLSTNRGITTRDRWDATRCDALFVNFLGATAVSIGTVLEIAWADSNRIPIIMVIEDSGNPHEHGMLKECVGFRVNNLEDGINCVKALFSTGFERG